MDQCLGSETTLVSTIPARAGADLQNQPEESNRTIPPPKGQPRRHAPSSSRASRHAAVRVARRRRRREEPGGERLSQRDAVHGKRVQACLGRGRGRGQGPRFVEAHVWDIVSLEGAFAWPERQWTKQVGLNKPVPGGSAAKSSSSSVCVWNARSLLECRGGRRSRGQEHNSAALREKRRQCLERVNEIVLLWRHRPKVVSVVSHLCTNSGDGLCDSRSRWPCSARGAPGKRRIGCWRGRTWT